MSNKKKIHVNTSALVDLKAALFKTQREVASGGRHQTHTTEQSVTSRKVSDKTSAIWRNVAGQGKKAKRVNTAGLAAAERKEKERVLSQQEEDALERSRKALEAKAAIYERLSRGEGLKEMEREDEEAGAEEGNTRYMVDFTKKLYEAQFDKVSSADKVQTSEKKVESGTNKGEEPSGGGDRVEGGDGGDWVEYVDSLGRSRKCLKEDLPEMIKRDRDMTVDTTRHVKRSLSPDLLSDDMRMERERKRWEEEAILEPGLPDEPVHYQSVRGGEVRSHGVGYYAFSTDTEKRQSEMEMLTKLKEQTISQREKKQQLQEKRKALLDARLAKVRQRKLKKQLDEGGSETNEDLKDDLKDADQGNSTASDISVLLEKELSHAHERAKLEEEKKEEEKRDAHVRPWDKGKVVDMVKKRKKELEDERPNEFAPPLKLYSGGYGGVGSSAEKKPRMDPTEPEGTSNGQVPQIECNEDLTTVPPSAAIPPPPPPPPPGYPVFYPPPPPPVGGTQYYSGGPPFLYAPPPGAVYPNPYLPPHCYGYPPPHPFVPPPFVPPPFVPPLAPTQTLTEQPKQD